MNSFTSGPWKQGKYGNSVVSDSAHSITIRGAIGNDAREYYGGNLICESVSGNNIPLIAIAPEMFALLETISKKDPVWAQIITPLLNKATLNDKEK